MTWLKNGKNDLNGFCGPGWPSSVEKTYKEEGLCVLEAAPLEIGAGVMGSSGGKEKRPGVFVEVLRDGQSFREVDRRSGDKVDVL